MSLTDNDSYFKTLLFSTLAAYNLSHICHPSIKYLPKHKYQLFEILKEYIKHEDLIEIILSYNAQKYYIQKECEILMDDDNNNNNNNAYLIMQLINQSLLYKVESLKYNIATKLSNIDCIRFLRINNDKYKDRKYCKYSLYLNAESVNIIPNSYFILHSNNDKYCISIICQWRLDCNQPPQPMIVILDLINHKTRNNQLIGIPKEIFLDNYQSHSISFISENNDKLIEYRIGSRYSGLSSYRDNKYGLKTILSFKKQSSLKNDYKLFDGISILLSNKSQISGINDYNVTHNRYNLQQLNMVFLGDLQTKNKNITFKKLIYIKKLQLNIQLSGRTLCFVIFIGEYQHNLHLFAGYQLLGSLTSYIVEFIILQTYDNDNDDDDDDVDIDDIGNNHQIIHNKINNEWIIQIECKNIINQWSVCSFLSFCKKETSINKKDWIIINNCSNATIDTLEIKKQLNVTNKEIKYNQYEIRKSINSKEMYHRSCFCVVLICSFLFLCFGVECFCCFWNDVQYLYD